MKRVKIEPEKRSTTTTTKPKKKRSYVKKGGHGGRRPGVGRKPGTKVKQKSFISRTIIKSQKEIIESAAASGDLPQVWLLKVMRCHPDEPIYTYRKKKRVRYYPTFEEQLAAAKAASPYFAAKLSSMAMTGEGGGPMKILTMDPTQLQGLPPEYLDVLRRVFGSLAGKEKEPLTIEHGGDANAYAESLD